MRTIQVKYDEVYAETSRLVSHITAEVVNRAETEYRQMQSLLHHNADGGVNAALIEAMESNRRKTVECADILSTLLQHISHSARQIEIAEQRIAQIMSASSIRQPGR